MVQPPEQLRALIRLLADSDPKVVALARGRLANLPEAVPLLEEASRAQDAIVRGRTRLLLDDIRFRQLSDAFARFADQADDETDLKEGAMLVARYGYPDVDAAGCSDQLDEIAGEIHKRLSPTSSLHDAIHIVNEHLFARLGFHGNQENYYDPDNSYLNRVLERRTGIPISLSAVYMLVCKRLNIPVQGVGMPGHFIVRCEEPDHIFWIDPFDGGDILTLLDCAEWLEQAGLTFDEEFLEPVSTRHIVARMLGNLVAIYAHTGQSVRAEQLESLRDMLINPEQA